MSVSHLINSAWITQNKHYCGITKRMNFNCSCLWKKWKHIFKWQRLRELNAIGYTFNFLRSSSLICSKQTFTVSSAIMISLPSSVFPSKANGETEKKKTFSSVEDFTPFWWHSGTQKSRRSEIWSVIAFGEQKENDQFFKNLEQLYLMVLRNMMLLCNKKPIAVLAMFIFLSVFIACLDVLVLHLAF